SGACEGEALPHRLVGTLLQRRLRAARSLWPVREVAEPVARFPLLPAERARAPEGRRIRTLAALYARRGEIHPLPLATEVHGVSARVVGPLPEFIDPPGVTAERVVGVFDVRSVRCLELRHYAACLSCDTRGR